MLRKRLHLKEYKLSIFQGVQSVAPGIEPEPLIL
jgi:hypothetical protein